MPRLPRLAQHPNSTASSSAVPPSISQPPPPPAPTTHGARLSSDATINITFGLFMAMLGLIAIYQAARVAALQARRYLSADQRDMQDFEMDANARVPTRIRDAEEVPQEQERRAGG